MTEVTRTKPRFPQLVRVRPEDVKGKRPRLDSFTYSLYEDQISDPDFHEVANRNVRRESAAIYTVTEISRTNPLPVNRRSFLIEYF